MVMFDVRNTIRAAVSFTFTFTLIRPHCAGRTHPLKVPGGSAPLTNEFEEHLVVLLVSLRRNLPSFPAAIYDLGGYTKQAFALKIKGIKART